MEMLLERPAGMSFTEYKAVQKVQKKVLRSYLKKGSLVHLSAQLIPVKNEAGETVSYLKTKGKTFTGKVKNAPFIEVAIPEPIIVGNDGKQKPKEKGLLNMAARKIGSLFSRKSA